MSSTPKGLSDQQATVIKRLWEAIGDYSVQCAKTGELAPSADLVAAVAALTPPASHEGAEAEVGEWVQSPLGNFPTLVWKRGFIAKVGTKLYTRPTTTEAGPASGMTEREETKLIEQRDEAHEVIDSLLDAVLGKDRPEWSSAYDFTDAVAEAQERMHTLLAAPAGPAPKAQGVHKPRPETEWGFTAADLHFYFQNLPNFMQGYEGQWVIVRNASVHGFYADYEAAVTAGYRDFPLDSPWLLQKVAPVPTASPAQPATCGRKRTDACWLPPAHERQAYIRDMEDTLQQLAAAVGQESFNADALIVRVKALAAQPSEGALPELRREPARKLYADYTRNHPTIHCNRFPSWEELSESERAEWRKKV